MPLDKPLLEISEHDLDALVMDQVPENRSMDYKEMINWAADAPKDELRRDVTSMANSAGGHLVIGIRDEGGIPVDVCGFELGNLTPEQYVLRLQEVLQSRIKPRVQGVGIFMLNLANGRWAAVIRIPNSFAKPHQVQIVNGDFQFWFRHDLGKQRMDVDELRDAILAGDTLAERRRTFRMERVGRVVAGETPVPLGSPPKIVLHIIPLGAFSAITTHAFATMTNVNLARIAPIGVHISYHRFNLDGFLTSLVDPSRNQTNSYLQIFRNGIFEAVDSTTAEDTWENGFFPATQVERYMMEAAKRYFAVQQEAGVVPPLLVMVSIVGVAGLSAANGQMHFLRQRYPIDRDMLMIPEILIESYPDNVETALRPIFDAMWNSAGRAGSPNYDVQGNWTEGG